MNSFMKPVETVMNSLLSSCNSVKIINRVLRGIFENGHSYRHFSQDNRVLGKDSYSARIGPFLLIKIHPQLIDIIINLNTSFFDNPTRCFEIVTNNQTLHFATILYSVSPIYFI